MKTNLFRYVFSFLLLSLFSTISSQSVFTLYDVRSLSLGKASVALIGFDNPAVINKEKEQEKYAYLSCWNHYGITKLNTLTACVGYPFKFLNTALVINRTGFDQYAQTAVHINVSKLLTSYLSAGLRFSYMNMYLSENENNKSLLTADIGVNIFLVDNWNIGVLATNPFCVNYRINDIVRKLPVSFRVGAFGPLAEGLHLSVEAEKEIDYDINFKTGLEYYPLSELALRLGMFTSPFCPTIGVGYKIRSVTFDSSFIYHRTLGLSPALSAKFIF